MSDVEREGCTKVGAECAIPKLLEMSTVAAIKVAIHPDLINTLHIAECGTNYNGFGIQQDPHLHLISHASRFQSP